MAGLRERKRKSTRTRIRDAALEAFLRDGYHATTMTAIAAEAEVAPRTLFRYFPTKADLLFSDAETRIALALDTIDRASPDEEPAAVLVRALACVGLDDPDADAVTQLRSELLRTSPAVAGVALHQAALATERLAAALSAKFTETMDEVQGRALVGAFIGAVAAASATASSTGASAEPGRALSAVAQALGVHPGPEV